MNFCFINGFFYFFFSVPTFVTFLGDIESPFEIRDYIRMYLGKSVYVNKFFFFVSNFLYNITGETKECTEFGKQYLERRSKYKNLQRAANAHIDDMCVPAPAITPSMDFQEVKVTFCIVLLTVPPPPQKRRKKIDFINIFAVIF